MYYIIRVYKKAV